MLKLELDWAADEAAPLGVDPDDSNVRVEKVTDVGPSRWPVIAVYVAHEEGAPAHAASMALDGWLKDVYLVGLEEPELTDQAEELAGMAEEV